MCATEDVNGTKDIIGVLMKRKSPHGIANYIAVLSMDDCVF
jgi:hypothetical protein